MGILDKAKIEVPSKKSKPLHELSAIEAAERYNQIAASTIWQETLNPIIVQAVNAWMEELLKPETDHDKTLVLKGRVAAFRDLLAKIASAQNQIEFLRKQAQELEAVEE